MAYFAPYIDATGFHIPTYADIVSQLVANAQNIFGADIYLDPSSQDYQWISAFSSMIYDSFLTAQATYNSRGPATSIGSALDVIVGVNGIVRQSAVYSTATVTITGTAGTTITNGVAGDVNGNYWSLTSPTIIGAGGTVSAVATCQTAGAIVANPGNISTIVTPTQGWTSVTNPAAATIGSAMETDSALRARQALSTAQPSQSMLQGIEGTIANVPGVTRFIVYENDTNTTDANGLPAHSITCVVDGTAAQAAIASAIWTHKGPGCLTNGGTTVPVTDSYGVVTNISFDIPAYVYVDVAITVKKLTGYTTDTTTAIQQAIATYLSAAIIGGPYVYISSLWGAALSANPTPTNPAFSIVSLTAAIHLGAQLTSALASGTAYTTLAVTALTQPIASGASLVIGSGATTQTVTTSAAASAGATSISVNSFTANSAYATDTIISFAQGTSDIPIAYNQVASGNSAYVSVTAQ